MKPQHTCELIGSLEYGVLKKDKIIPNMTMFTDIPKLGGSFPKLASKVSSWWFGYLMDRIVRMVLQRRDFDKRLLEDALVEVIKHTNDKQCGVDDLLREEKYYEDVAIWLLEYFEDNTDNEYEPEWIHNLVMGHPDLVIGDTIYDVKTTGRWGRMRIHTIFQLLSYAALSQTQGKNIRYVGVVLPAQRIVESYDISKWDGSKYLDLLNEKARDKHSCQTIDPELLLQYSVVRSVIGSHVKRLPSLRRTINTLDPHQPIQIFLSGRMNLDHKITDADIAKSLIDIQRLGKRVYVHMPYSINLARLNFKPRNIGDKKRSIDDCLIKQVETTACFGGRGAVVHIGKQVEMTYDDAMDNMITNVSIAAAFSTPECPLLIETDSGGSLIDNPSDLADFWLGLDDEIRSNVAICVDTCHVFAAGYDNMETLQMFQQRGVPVNLIHYNDSKFAKGTKKDRHARFGHGLIGHRELVSVAIYAVAQGIPMVTE